MSNDATTLRSAAEANHHYCGAAVILLVGDKGSTCLSMASSLRTRGHNVVCASTKEELKESTRLGQEFSLACLDLTCFTAEDFPLLARLAEQIVGNGVILWTCRRYRPDLEDRLVSFCGGTFVRVCW